MATRDADPAFDVRRVADAGMGAVGRSSGVLLHVTSLDSGFGVGDLGPAAEAWVDALAAMEQRWWQMLPIGPTGFGDSPYQSPSSFAGNPLLLSPMALVDDGLVDASDLDPLARLPIRQVDFGRLAGLKQPVLTSAAEAFLLRGGKEAHARFDGFRHRHRPRWLAEYGLYAALKDAHDLRPWYEWDTALANRDTAALGAARAELEAEILRHEVLQFFFFEQWRRLRTVCAGRGIGLVGDLPLYVAHDSADVWANRHLFNLDADGMPVAVSGVPPDYFSATGQRWGNPLYDWEEAFEEDFAWWRSRLRHTLELFDVVRLDHFRGIAGYWEIPASEPTAERGRWVEGPGAELLEQLRVDLGALPLLAEDLGFITDDVVELRHRYGLPGIRVAQFGFDEAPDTAIHDPARYPVDVWAYTGTHDNDTTAGWFETVPPDAGAALVAARRRLSRLIEGEPVHLGLMRMVADSRAMVSIFPVQDLLGLGSEARMNLPGTADGNWTWRLLPGELTDAARERLRTMTVSAGRA